MEWILYADNCVLDFIQRVFRCDVLDFVMPYITLLGENGILWIILGISLLFYKKTKPMGISILMALMIGFVICNLTLKPLIARVRPYDANGFEGLLVKALSDYSFPSGHTLASFEMAVCVYMFDKKYGIIALIIAALIGFSRLYLYVHYPSDVIFGAVLGIFIGYFSSYIVNKRFSQCS